jgi:tetrahydromethanopterin S-methyltransferase subunit A
MPSRGEPPAIVGDVVFGAADSPIAVCTLGSRALLPALAGRPEIAVAGRVFTENVGIERMVQNLAAFGSVRFLIVCGRETSHRVGETIVALHKNGLDASQRVIGSTAPDPTMPNLSVDDLYRFQTRVEVLDMIGTEDAEEIVATARRLVAQPREESVSELSTAAAPATVEVVSASRDQSSAWEYDPVGYFVVFVDRGRDLLRVEHHTREHLLRTVFEGRRAEELCHTIVRRGDITLLAHAAYLGRELAKAETALEFGLDYDQDRPLKRPDERENVADDQKEERLGDRSGNRRAP